MDQSTLPEHVRRPHIRAVHPMPVKSQEGQQLVALRDPLMISQQMIIIPPQVMNIIQQFRGERPLDEIAQQLNADLEKIQELAERLDEVGLLWGPTFERMEQELREKLKERGSFQPRASSSLGEDETKCREAIDQFFEETEDPELEGAARAIVAPHLDYQRGWPNYAAAYYHLRNQEKPDRIVILGTNHFGLGDGVVMTEYGFESPLGACPADAQVVEKMIDRLGPELIIDQLDHLPEHSIDLHLPWIQYCFGNVPVVAALIPDPLQDMITDDQTSRIGFDPFVNALSEVLSEVDGTTFYVASSDLSHVGPQFGEPRPVDEQRRIDVERHDREMMAKFLAGDADEFLSALKWNRNPTRWCSVGNMAALLKLAKPSEVELIDYRQAFDEQGQAMVSSAAMVLM